MILAAGLGTRLRPLTYELPKPVIPVLGRPLCSYTMEFLFRAGVTRFVFNLHHHPKIVKQQVAAWAGRKIPVDYTVEPVILGTGGGIRNASEFLRDGTFVAANGDTIVRFPFARALAFHKERKALATLVLFPDPRRRYTPVRIDGEGRITGFGGEPPGGGRAGFYTGVQIVEPAVIEKIPGGGPSCIIRETYTPLVAEGAPVYGFLTTGLFREFGTPADYLDGTLAILAERLVAGTLPRPAAPGATFRHPVYIAPGARVAPGAAVGPDAVVEKGATIGEGAAVSRALVWPGASVSPGATVANAVVTRGGIVAAG
ncbi:MAG: NDP-sugar synthase [Deltaproteobacteria bacterium]|nr:NDP-sugar synthase [Deltaproteobacteria bacterium]